MDSGQQKPCLSIIKLLLFYSYWIKFSLNFSMPCILLLFCIILFRIYQSLLMPACKIKISLSVSMKTTKRKLIPVDILSFHLQNTLFWLSQYQCLCIFPSTEYFVGWCQCMSVWNAELHYPLTLFTSNIWTLETNVHMSSLDLYI